MHLHTDTIFTLLSTHAVSAAVLALAVALLSRVVRHAAIVHALWVVVLLKLLMPPLFELAVLPASEPAPRSAAVATWTAAPALATTAEPAFEALDPHRVETLPERRAPIPWTSGLLLLFGAGSLVVAVLAALRLRRFQRDLGDGLAVPQRVRRRAGELAGRLGLSRLPRLRVVAARISPMLWPRPGGVELVLPQALLDRLSAAELDAVLSHELAHLRRRDHWVRLLELLATVLFWWHPVVWWARRRLRRVEERSCDAWVAHVLPGQARAYADGLIKTMEFLAFADRPLPATGTGIETRHDMKERLTMILTRRTPRLLGPWHRLLLAALAVALLVVVPTRADRGAEGESEAQADQARFREEALQLERRELELEQEMRGLEAQRRQLDYEREMLKHEAEVSHLERKARELESTGEPLEAELHRERQAAVERDSELIRERYELERRMIEEILPMEQELRAKRIRVEELKLAGEHDRAVALHDELKSGKQRLGELTHEHDQRRAQLERQRLEHRLEVMESRRRTLSGAGREEEAARLAAEAEFLRAESRMAELEVRLRGEQSARERKLAASIDKLRALEAAGEEEAALKMKLEIERYAQARALRDQAKELEMAQRHSLQEETELKVMAEKEAQHRKTLAIEYYRQAQEMRAQQLKMNIDELEAKLENASPGEKEALAGDLEKLKREMDDLLAEESHE